MLNGITPINRRNEGEPCSLFWQHETFCTPRPMDFVYRVGTVRLLKINFCPREIRLGGLIKHKSGATRATVEVYLFLAKMVPE